MRKLPENHQKRRPLPEILLSDAMSNCLVNIGDEVTVLNEVDTLNGEIKKLTNENLSLKGEIKNLTLKLKEYGIKTII